MYRFVALTWDGNDPTTRETAKNITTQLQKKSPDLEQAHDSHGLLVLHAGEYKNRMQAYPLDPKNESGQSGVIVGKVFPNPEGGQHIPGNADFDPLASRKVFETGGRHLVEQYWGRYIAFMNDTRVNKVSILRDPMGELPCFHVSHKGVKIFFSCTADIKQLDFLEFTINWDFIRVLMKNSYPVMNDTALSEVSELLAGECLEITPDGIEKTFLWDRERIIKGDVIYDAEEAMEQLRQMTISCVSAWGGCYDRVLLYLSGGLDSSLVLSLLAQSPNPPDITCYHAFTPGTDGEERVYARLAAEYAGTRIIEKERFPTKIDLHDMLDVPVTAKPGEYLFEIEQGRVRAETAKEYGAEAIFSGFGGDQIFFHHRTHFCVTDYMDHYGIRPELLTIMAETARVLKISVWAVLRKVLKDKLFKASANYEDVYADMTQAIMMTAETRTSLENGLNHSHEWLEETSGISNGKKMHIRHISLVPGYYGYSLPRYHIEPVQPLLAQPLVELCLRIPTWHLSFQGRDRGLARMAFANHLPREIIWRESKGSMGGLVEIALKNNSGFMNDFFLKGHLMKENILDPRVAEKVLAGDFSEEESEKIKVDVERTNILFYLYAETWLKSWVTTN